MCCLLIVLAVIVGFVLLIWFVATDRDTSFITFSHGNGKQTTLLMDPTDNFKSVESELREKLGLSSNYTAEFYVGGKKFGSFFVLDTF
jgi:hypothetical protein